MQDFVHQPYHATKLNMQLRALLSSLNLAAESESPEPEPLIRLNT